MNLSGQVALVTGASEGIGASCARLFLNKGASLSLTGLAASHFTDSLADRTLITAGDITDPSVRRRIVENTLARFARIDLLINNVGVGQYGLPSEVDTDVAKRLFDINVFAPLALTQLVIPIMRQQRSGTIVNIGSVGGKVSLPWSVMYCSTKWAVHCVDDSLRRELKQSGIRVIKVCPGIVATKFREHVLAGTAPATVEAIRRVVTPDQVAQAIVRGVEHNHRTVYVPRIGRVFAALEAISPRIMDLYLAASFRG